MSEVKAGADAAGAPGGRAIERGGKSGARVTVRFARREEVGAVWAMVLALAEYEKLSDRVTGSAAVLAEHLFGERPIVECLVAERARALIGYALFFPTYSSFRTQPMMWLEDLYVCPEARGAGAGRALLARLAEIVLERGGWRLSWEVLDWNQPSIEFYERLGARRAHSDWFTYALDEAGMRVLAGAGSSSRRSGSAHKP